jgi:hypothetical protein
MNHQGLHTAIAELRLDDRLSATTTHWNEGTTEKGDKTPRACCYAASILINGDIKWTMWGIGYCSWSIPVVVSGIESLLQVMPEGRRLDVYALNDLHRYIKFGGIGRSGKDLGCSQAMETVIAASDAHRWSLRPKKNLAEAPGHGNAKAIAIGKAKSAALKHKADHAPAVMEYPKPIILQEFVDAYPG